MYGFTYRVACPACGSILRAAERDEHVCVAELQRAVAEFEAALAAWLETPQGRFASWDAERRRGAGRGFAVD